MYGTSGIKYTQWHHKLKICVFFNYKNEHPEKGID